MNNRLPFMTIVIIFMLVISGCSEKPVQPDTPQTTAWLMKVAIDQGNYERFRELFAEGRKEVITKEQFQTMKDLTTSRTEYRNYEFVRFDNDTMMLIRLTPEKDRNGKYYIEDVKIIPKELKSLFES
jgi:hypothetical protein